MAIKRICDVCGADAKPEYVLGTLAIPSKGDVGIIPFKSVISVDNGKSGRDICISCLKMAIKDV